MNASSRFSTWGHRHVRGDGYEAQCFFSFHQRYVRGLPRSHGLDPGPPSGGGPALPGFALARRPTQQQPRSARHCRYKPGPGWGSSPPPQVRCRCMPSPHQSPEAQTRPPGHLMHVALAPCTITARPHRWRIIGSTKCPDAARAGAPFPPCYPLAADMPALGFGPVPCGRGRVRHGALCSILPQYRDAAAGMSKGLQAGCQGNREGGIGPPAVIVLCTRHARSPGGKRAPQ
jgi:hypothetical protein